ncbi:MAG: hypothetical protein ACXWWX_01685 [Actinomycetota bacterium]
MRSRRTIVVLILAVIVLLLTAIPGKATFAKLYTLNVSPTSVTTSGAREFTLTYYNKSLYKIGSSNLAVPVGLTGVTNVSTTKGTATVVDGGLSGFSIQLRNMSLALFKTAVVKLTATVPCGTASYGWTAVTKSSSSFSGSADFALTSPSSLTTTASSTCPASALEFVDQPVDAVPGGSIGDPITVRAVDANGATVTSFVGQVTLTSSGGPGSLPPGTSTATAVNGVATFSGLTLDMVGQYVLTASATGLTSGVSDAFTVAEGDLGCTSGNDTATEGGAGVPDSSITRQDNQDGSPCVLVLYSLRTRVDPDGTQYVIFEKDLTSQPLAQFTGSTTWELETAEMPVPATQISYDGGDSFHPMEWCLADGATGPADGFPDLPGIEFWCITGQSSVFDPITGKITVTETDFGIGDPTKRR